MTRKSVYIKTLVSQTSETIEKEIEVEFPIHAKRRMGNRNVYERWALDGTLSQIALDVDLSVPYAQFSIGSRAQYFDKETTPQHEVLDSYEVERAVAQLLGLGDYKLSEEDFNRKINLSINTLYKIRRGYSMTPIVPNESNPN